MKIGHDSVIKCSDLCLMYDMTHFKYRVKDFKITVHVVLLCLRKSELKVTNMTFMLKYVQTKCYD